MEKFTDTPSTVPNTAGKTPVQQSAAMPGYYVSPAAYRRPPKPRLASDKQDVTAAAVLAVLAVLGADLSLYGGFHIGYAVSWLAVVLCGLLYLGKHTLRPGAYSLFCLTAAAAGSGVFVWHNDVFLRFLCFCGMIFLTMLALCEATGNNPRGSATLATVIDVLAMLVVRPLEYLGRAIPALFRVQQDSQIQKRRFGGVLIGLLCAVPALVILLPLLINADAAFEGLMQYTVLEHLGEAFISVAVGLPLFAVIFSRLFSLRHPQPTTAAPVSPRPLKGVDAPAINAFLGVISGVYVLYLFSQLAYFVSGFSGILPADYTVAQYARRGFFEMCAICAVNLVIAALALLISRKQEGKAPRSTRCLLLFVLVFSLALVATALSKMVLYVNAFGMTRLRVLTSLFMLLLAAVLVFVCIRLFVPRFAYMRAAVVAAALLGLTAAYADVDTVVARYNVTAYQSGVLKEVDVSTLEELSDGAVPYLWALCEDKNPAVAQQAVQAVYNKLMNVAWVQDDGSVMPHGTVDWRSYNVDSRRARRLLLKNSRTIVEQYRAYYNDWALGENEI